MRFLLRQRPLLKILPHMRLHTAGRIRIRPMPKPTMRHKHAPFEAALHGTPHVCQWRDGIILAVDVQNRVAWRVVPVKVPVYSRK